MPEPDATIADLRALAEAAGLEIAYHDIFGHLHEATDAALAALLGALGLPAGSPEQVRASLADLEAERQAPGVPPVTVLRQGGESAVIVTAPRAPTDASLPALSWHIRLEDGGTRSDTLTEPVALEGPDTAAAPRILLPLPDDLPEGYHTLEVTPEDAAPLDEAWRGRLIIAPSACYLPPILEEGHRVWGLGCQLYTLRSKGNWGIGDFADLSRLAAATAGYGGAAVGLNPLHALFPTKPADASPYSPNSRLFVNPLYIAVPEVPEFALSEAAQRRFATPETQAALTRCRSADLVDYPAVAALKQPFFEILFETFERTASAERQAAFDAFLTEGGPRLYRFALFQALQEAFPDTPWSQWPEAYRCPATPTVEAFARSHARRVRLHLWLQFEADRQFGRASDALDAAGGRIGLYRDLAVGASPDGADTWMDPDAYVRTARFGAPPDDLGPLGQDWGLPPLNPRALRHSAYGPFIDMLRANMRHAGALRIDHAMALQHLFCIPPGLRATDGIYVTYPMDDMLGILALESHRNRCLIVGEDLGTVPEGFRERMARENILSYRLLYFQRYDSGLFKRPDAYPVQALATATSHDLATIAGHWRGWDIALRHRLGLTRRDQREDDDQAVRGKERHALVAAMQDQGLLPQEFPLDAAIPDDATRSLTLACHRFLARTPSQVMLINIDDLAGEVAQVNVPGTVTEYPNWRRRLRLSLEALVDGPGSALAETARYIGREF